LWRWWRWLVDHSYDNRRFDHNDDNGHNNYDECGNHNVVGRLLEAAKLDRRFPAPRMRS
jgi:hypothetical protein